MTSARTAFLGPGEVARFSISKESFLTFKADILRREVIRNYRPFHSNREA
jgi:hypothetical protein